LAQEGLPGPVGLEELAVIPIKEEAIVPGNLGALGYAQEQEKERREKFLLHERPPK
jgi:hypothetical protein